MDLHDFGLGIIITRAGHYAVRFGLGQDPNQIETDWFFKFGIEYEPNLKTKANRTEKFRFGSVRGDLVLISLDLDHEAFCW